MHIIRIFFFVFAFLAAAIIANAQTGTFFEAGVAASFGSNSKDKGFPEAYGAIGFKIAQFEGSTVQLRARAKLSKTPELGDLFTRDGGIRHPSGELKTAFEARWNLSTESYFKPFIAAGAEYGRQFGLNAAPYSLHPSRTWVTHVTDQLWNLSPRLNVVNEMRAATNLGSPFQPVLR